MKIASAVAAVCLAVASAEAWAEPLSPAEILKVLPGRWAMDEPSVSQLFGFTKPPNCAGEHVIEIRLEKKNGKTIYISRNVSGKYPEARSTVRFISSKKDLTGPGAIVIQYEGEDRRDAKGAPVVWHLVMTDPDTFYWHREDWRAGSFTAASHRCPAHKGLS